LEKVADEFAQHRSNYPFSFVPLTPVEVRIYVDLALSQREIGERYPFAVGWKGTIVGSTSYSSLDFWTWPEESPHMRRQGPDAVEIGATWIAPSAQRSRCNTEAKFLLLNRAFEEWRVHRIALRTDERNDRSRRAIERIGARFEGVRRVDMVGRDGNARNSADFSIVADEWPGVKVRLEQMLAKYAAG
jgi:RimJ/RimL family protein N-acetyltransferase